MESENGAKAEKSTIPSATLGDIADMKMTLKIWDVPPELGRRFIGAAKASYANKSWLLLQDLMMKADKYDQMIASGRMVELEGILKEHDSRIAMIERAIMQAGTSDGKDESEAKTPKTFGK